MVKIDRSIGEMTFVRQIACNWHQDVPGARWYKADLHIHTIDDIAGKSAKMPSCISGPPDSQGVLSEYARRFLQAAVENDVKVLGITPHSPRVGSASESSATWRIVDEWNCGIDDDGIPFREKIYAVFPGFEPSFQQGRKGLHLSFLFDPEIGRDNYLKMFDQVMGGVDPWPGRELQVANKTALEAFQAVAEFVKRENDAVSIENHRWSYIVLAPHIDSEKGLLSEQRAQILERFQFEEIAGLELGDDQLPSDALTRHVGLKDRMDNHHMGFFHGSDCYRVEEIGKRHSWFKLARPRIEALRQAFIASESRIRIGYERDSNSKLRQIAEPPDVTLSKRPWLKSLSIEGSASFFGSNDNTGRSSRFDFSPDLTCIIGGSMTGKSTLLDGLRAYIGAPMPQDSKLRQEVEARGRERFLAGSAEVTLECPGQDPTASLQEQWPATFHSQNELQRLAQSPDAVEEILAGLVASETKEIKARELSMQQLDRELVRVAEHLTDLDAELDDAEQALARSLEAKDRLDVFTEAGIDNLNRASRELNLWRKTAVLINQVAKELDQVIGSVVEYESPKIVPDVAESLRNAGVKNFDKLEELLKDIRESLTHTKTQLGAINAINKSVTDALITHETNIRSEIDRSLADRGFVGSEIKELQALNQQASYLMIYGANLDQIQEKRDLAQRSFESKLADRDNLNNLQREAFDRVIETILTQFDGEIKASRIVAGDSKPLDHFIRELSQRGITRWWNDIKEKCAITPQSLLTKLDSEDHKTVGMTDAVAKTFQEHLKPAMRRQLKSIRCRDIYVLELRVENGVGYRQLDGLSGGQRVSLLLSLLLETNDDRPLVIDQPEDELDNRFVYETVLPALKRLKGRRQILMATHSANFVVNGDADQVILLDATGDRGRVVIAGAIEDPAVRDAIIRTVDGGDEAFRLRQLKYGF